MIRMRSFTGADRLPTPGTGGIVRPGERRSGATVSREEKPQYSRAGSGAARARRSRPRGPRSDERELAERPGRLGLEPRRDAALEVEQRLLALQAAAVAGERPVRPDHAVAGHDDGQGVAADRRRDAADDVGPPDGARDLAVRGGLAVRDVEQGAPDGEVEGARAQVEGEVLERAALAGEVRVDRGRGRVERDRVAAVPATGAATSREGDRREAVRARLERERAERGLADVPDEGVEGGVRGHAGQTRGAPRK